MTIYTQIFLTNLLLAGLAVLWLEAMAIPYTTTTTWDQYIAITVVIAIVPTGIMAVWL